MPETLASDSSTADAKQAATDIGKDSHDVIRTLIERQGASSDAHLTHVPVCWRGLSVSAPDTGPVTVKTLPRACLNTFGILTNSAS